MVRVRGVITCSAHVFGCKDGRCMAQSGASTDAAQVSSRILKELSTNVNNFHFSVDLYMLMQGPVQCQDVFVPTIANIRPTSPCEAFTVVKLFHTRRPLQLVQNAAARGQAFRLITCLRMLRTRKLLNIPPESLRHELGEALQRIQLLIRLNLHASSGYLCPSSRRTSATSS